MTTLTNKNMDEEMLTDEEINADLENDRKIQKIQREKELKDRLRETMIAEYSELKKKQLELDHRAMQAGMEDLRMKNDKERDLFSKPPYTIPKNNTKENTVYKTQSDGQHNDKQEPEQYRRAGGHRTWRQRGRGGYNHNNYNSTQGRPDVSNHNGLGDKNNVGVNNYGQGGNTYKHGAKSYGHNGTYNGGISKRAKPLSDKR
ncbi:hypothetical protein HCN44_010812 [Aphidius gifuensis]|uniref:Uncharacterized protein n=1 Tax=Aphidius gifuensis TaxID=684658 RepID=A0A834XJH0_APHGI|nr:hypothetical protein HCN44_010812 [Aphidius gifuensis]